MEKHVCPWYMGYFLASPLRRLAHNPEKILEPYLKTGMKVLEVGPGMGFFSLPMARMVGEAGLVYCVDVQEKMIKILKRRAEKAGLSNRIEVRLCGESSLEVNDLSDKIDFALTFAVVHEVPDQKHLFEELFATLKRGGKLLISEPTGHVTQNGYNETLECAKSSGFKVVGFPDIKRTLSALLVKQ